MHLAAYQSTTGEGTATARQLPCIADHLNVPARPQVLSNAVTETLLPKINICNLRRQTHTPYRVRLAPVSLRVPGYRQRQINILAPGREQR